MAFKELHLSNETGKIGRVPDGAISNIGGTSHSTFTVNGVPVLLNNGFSPDGNVTLQSVYAAGPGVITLTTAKPFILSSSSGNTFSVHQTSGTVSISGDLFITGQLNSVNFTAFYNAFSVHTNNIVLPKHLSSQIYTDDAAFDSISGSNVQSALQSIDSSISISSKTFKHTQNTPSTAWVITHNRNSEYVMAAVYDADKFQVLPDQIQIIDDNTVHITFGSAQAGYAALFFA